ncbi:MAG: YeiH family protein [Cyanobacteria bacterium P01_F01_bin.143]
MASWLKIIGLNLNKDRLGLCFTSILGLSIIFLATRPVFKELNSLTLAIIIGIFLANTIKIPKSYEPGIKFANKKILKLAIIIFGIKLNFKDTLAIGDIGVIITLITISSTFLFASWLGKKLDLNQKFIQLIAAGTAICGTSAIVATNAVVEASEEDTAYSIATVTAFGTLAMITYPLLGNLLNLSPSEFGFWCGISIQQTAQVITASFHHGMSSADFATITKLSRVIFLAPAIILLGYASDNSSDDNPRQNSPKYKSLFSKITIPWFVIFFLLMSLLNTYAMIDEPLKKMILNFDTYLFTVSMLAMGLETKISSFRKVGIKPFYLGGLTWLFIASISLVLIKIFQVNTNLN